MFILLFIGLPLSIVLVSYAYNISILSMLDIRELFSYLSYDGSQFSGRIHMTQVTALVFGIIAFFTVTISLLLQIKKRITNRSSGT